MKKTTRIFGLLLTLFGLVLVTGCTPNTDTPVVPEESEKITTTANYTVKHFKQNLDDDNYTEEITETLNGTIGAQTAAVAKTYTGFTAPATITQAEIKSDGTTVVEIRYTRNTYNVSYLDGTDKSLSLPQNGTYKYGKKISVNPNVLNSTIAYIVWTDGTTEYNTDGNNNSFNITVTGDVTLTAKELWFKAGAPVKFWYGFALIENAPSPLPEAISEIELKKKYESIRVTIHEEAFGDESYTYIENDSASYSELRLMSISYDKDCITIKFSGVSE